MSKYITSNLYATLRDNGINMPTEEVFYKNMSDPNYRKTLHKGLQDKGFDLDDIREFQVHWHNKFANDPNYKGKDEVTSKPVAQQPKQQSQPTQQSSQRMLSGQRVPKQQHIERVETTSKPTTDEDLAKTFVMSPEWQEDYARGKEVENEIKAEDAKNKQIADNYNAMSKLEDTFAAYEQSQDVAELFPGAKSESSTTWRDRVAQRKEGEAQAKAKVDQERKELRQRMQLLKDNPDAYNELFGIKDVETPEVRLTLGNSFANGKPVDKRGNVHDNWVSKGMANQRIDAEDKARQLGMQSQELQDMLNDPMALDKEMTSLKAELTELTKQRDAYGSQFAKEHPWQMMANLMGRDSFDNPYEVGMYGVDAMETQKQMNNVIARINMLTEAKNAFERGSWSGHGFWNNVKNIGKGMQQFATEINSYTDKYNIESGMALNNLANKIERGEMLTDEEMSWFVTAKLKEEGEKAASQGPTTGAVGYGAPASLEYMVTMAINPAKGASKTISDKIIETGVRRFGKSAFTKMMAKATGMLTEGAVLSTTLGADNVASDALGRMAGKVGFDDGGNVAVADRVNPLKAMYQSTMASTIESAVEMMGVPIIGKATKGIGKVATKLADAMSYGKVSKLLSAMDKSQIVNWTKGMSKATGWQGLGEEWAEENVTMLANAIIVGDNEIADMFDTRTQLEILGTCALISGAMSVTNVAGFAGEFHKVNREFKKAKQEVLRQFSSDVWASLDNLITNAQDEDLTVRLADAMDGMSMNREQRSAIMNYLTALKRYQKFNELNDGGKFIIGDPQQAQATQSTSTYEIDSDITLKDEIGNPIDAHIIGRDANGNYMVESSQPINGKRVQPLSADQLDAMVIPNTPDGIQQSEVDGYNLTDANQQAEVSMLTDNARESVATLLGVTPDAVDATLQQVLGDNPTDAKIDARFGNNAQVVKDYMYNVAKTKGMSARLADDIADATAESDRAIDAVDNNGNVVTAKDAEGNDVNVVSGNIVTYEDNQIDVANSDASVVIRHADGATEMVAPTSLTEVVSMPTEQAKATQAQAIAQQMQQAFSDKLNGALDYSQGQQYTMLNADGSTTDVTILADNGDGNVTVTARDGNKEGGVTDGKQIVLPKSQIQQGVREFKRNQLRGETAQQTSITQAEAQPTEVTEPTQEPTTPADEHSNVAYEDMDADSAWDRLVAESGDDVDIATMVAQSNIEDAQKALDKAKKQTPKLVGTTEEKLATAKAFKESVVKAQNDLAKWQEIADVPKRRASLQTEQTESQTDLQTESQTESQGQQVTGKLPASEEVTTETPTESESTPQVGLAEDARTRTLGDKTRKMLDAMAKRLGLQVEFVDEIVTGKDEKGRNLYANAVIVGKNVKIAWHNRNRAIDFLLGHEFTHRMQDLSPEAYAEFVEAAKQVLGEEEWNKRIKRMRDIYKSQGKTISEQGIIDEVVADYAGELVEERGVFDNFVERNKNNRGLLSRIADVLKSIKEFFTLGKQRKINNAIARLEALIESASEANLRGDVVNMEKDRYSVSSIFEGTGAIVFNEEGGANIDKDGNFYVIINGKQYDGNNLITLDDIKADKRSVLNMMVEDAIKEGNVTEEHADVIMKKYVDIMNMFLVEGLAENGGYANMADKWMWVGETVYKTVQPNSDKQYTKSIDITTVCKKNEAVIRAMSEMQKRVGYGITPAQILDIYIETQESGYQVPCPVCYVFSRYLRNGKYASGAILGIEQYGEHLPGGSGETWTADQWVAELRKLEKIDKDNKALYNQASADIVEAETMIDNLGLRLQQSNNEAERKELREQIEKADARYRAALNIFSQSALTSWIKTFAIQGSDDKGYKMRDDAQYPEDIELFKEHALDLRKAGETQTLFPAIQRLRNSGGSSTGKAVGFESNNALGDVISGIATGNNDTAYARASKATTEKEFETNRKKATENFKKASKYIKQQTLRGGQRMWSWSDNIEALMPDVVINLMQLELLGGALQTYSKQLEGVNLVARMGGYVNGSLMAKDNGYTEVTEDMIKVEDGKEVLAEDITETIQEPIVGRGIVDRTRVLAQAGSPVIEVDGKKYVLIFDDVIGIDPHGREVNGVHMKGLFDLNKELSKAGNIIVGMNDTHIRVGLADSRIFFIIPWHASGANNHILTEMFRVLGADISSMVSTDYTDMQSEKDYLPKNDDDKMPEIEQSVRDIWNAHKNETDWKCGVKGGIDSSKETISDSQKHYRELRQAIFDGELINNKAWLREVQADEFLSQVYDRVQSGTIGNSMTEEDNKHIYPYEYWDKSKTYDEADINGERYIEYCRRLGFSPKFSGIHGKKEYKNTGNFTNDKGYWKLLVDRRMYDIHDKFQDLDPVTSEDYTNELVHPGNTNKEFVISEVADAKATNKIVDRVIDKETSRTGTMPTVDYTLSHQKAYDNYKKEFDVMMADKAYVKANDAVSQAQAKLDALVEEGATPSRIKNATEKLRKAQEALQQAKKAATSAEKEAQKSRFSLTNLTEEEQRIVDEAKANGTYLKAPNGKASNLNERQWIQVRTKAFKDWFGDWENDPENASKVVDENGEPMVVYHGSYWNPLEEAEGKAVFDDSFRGTSSGDNGWFGRGHYFAFGNGKLSKAEARYYGPNVFDAFLNIRNPFMYAETIYKDYNPTNGKSEHNASLVAINTAKAFPNLVEDFQVEQFDGNGDKVDSISIKDYADIFDKIYKEKEFIVEESDEYPNVIIVKADPIEHTDEDLNISWVEYGWEMRMIAPAEREDKQFTFAHHYLTQEVYGREGHSFYILPDRDLKAFSESEEFTSILKERGYDGVLQSAIGDEAVAFEPTQIKSATDNVGTFDASNPDIRYSLASEMARDAVMTALEGAGIDVEMATPEMVEDVLRARDAEFMSAKKRRALETVSSQDEYQQTVVSSADGAKVLKNLDSLAKEYQENTVTHEKTFLGKVAEAIGAKKYGSNSQYATFETVNGKIVTIRLADHNATVSNFDIKNESEGISIVVSAKKSEGIYNDGDAHIVEYYYDAIKLRKAEGKPLADIVKSIKQALYSGVFNDSTGLAEYQEVNIPEFHIAYHGSGAKFDEFDHSHMGEGEGAQAYGWGTYLTEVEGIAKMYAGANGATMLTYKGNELDTDGLLNQWRVIKDLYDENKGRLREMRNRAERILSLVEEDNTEMKQLWQSVVDTLKQVRAGDLKVKPKRNLYTVEIPDDTGKNYLDYDKEMSKNELNEVRNKLEAILAEGDYKGVEKELKRELDSVFVDGLTASDVYGNVSAYLGGDKQASEFFNEMGYVGIKYPANYRSGGNKDGKKNFVIFNDSDMKITDRVEFLQTPDGVVYGWTIGGKIFLTEQGMNAETPIHEYTHLWANAMRKNNEQGWESIKDLLRGTPMWDEVLADKNYSNIHDNEDLVASEVLSRYSGKENAKRLEDEAQRMIDEAKGIGAKADAVSLIDRVRRALQKFWDWVGKDLFGIKDFDSIEQVTDRVLYDLMNQTGLNAEVSEGEGQQMRYSLRTKPEPKKTIKVYKLFNVDENGNPQALFIDAANSLEVGVWYDADSPTIKDLEGLETEWSYLLDNDGNVVDKKPLKRGKGGNFVGLPSKADVNKATQDGQRWMTVSTSKSGEKAYHTVGINGAGGVSTYALRPGWHATNVPSARHIGVGKDGANAKYRGANQRWFEIEISADVDYNEEARERYLKAHPTYSREKAYSDLKGDIPERIPEDGYYNFKTNSNANPNQDWYIAGAIKIVRPLTEEEGRKISRSKGIAEDLPYKDGVKNFDDTSRYSLIGEQGATALDKSEEATHRMDNLAVAREMEADGKDAKAIRMATGWERGADGKWRYEIEDVKLLIGQWTFSKRKATLNQIVEYADELFDAYPELKFMAVQLGQAYSYGGFYSSGEKYIKINIGAAKRWFEFMNKPWLRDGYGVTFYESEKNYNDAIKQIQSTLVHEIQHAIQDIEGFAQGGSPKGVYNEHSSEITTRWEEWKKKALVFNQKHPNERTKTERDALMREKRSIQSAQRKASIGKEGYNRLAGEVESRNAQKRMRMTPEQRRETLLRETEDVAREDQIFLMKNGAQETERKYSLQGGRSIADKYEKKVNTKGKGGAMHLSKFNFMEAWQDEMRALKEVQRIIEQEYGIVLESYEDAYMAENAMSSIAKASWDRYINEVYEPMMRIHDEWIRSGESNESINHYLIAKSGLERNRELMVRDALAEMNKMDAQIINGEYSGTVLRLANALRQGQISQDEYDAQVQEAKNKKAQALEDVKSVQQGRVDAYRAERDALREQLKNGDISYEEFNRLSDEVALKHAKTEEIADYSGLTALAKMHGSKDWQGFAEQMVRDFEAKHSNTDVMWEHINNNTKSAVDYSYKSGVTSKQAKDHLDQMFLWYVPMKGNADVEAEDIYTYVNDKSSSFTPTVKGAKGHSEYVSEDVMALIANTMQSAILQGERNKVKQKFLNMVQNYPTDLFTLDRGWVVMQGNEWVESHPEIKADYTPEQIREAIEKHDAEMRELEEQGLAMSKEGALRLGVPFRATQNEQEHAISVMRNGEKMTIYVNGNPRVAQAINGKLKDTKESLGMRLWHTFTRWLSAGMTGYSIDFTGANLSRDTHHSSAIMFLKYGFKEQIRYILNGFADLPALIRGISGKSGNTKRDAYFQEFLANGGETGYANLRSLDDWKVENKRRIGRLRTMGGRAWGHTRNVLPYIAEAFGYINRLAETSSRFNAYVRARERNQDVATAVSEAKNITVNFNKKGSAKTAGAFGFLANLYRETMMFANPVIQGLYQFLKVGKEHKSRFTVLCLGHVALGGVVPILNQMLFELLGGDDEDEYYNQSEYQRRTNLLIYTGHGYIKIPLAPIFRELYALGDVFYGVIQKKIKMEDGAKDVVGLVRSMFSIEGQSAIDDDWSLVRFILPEQLSVVADISDNVNFMGMPIYKDSDYLRFDPEYQKVYKNAWSPLVATSAKLNELLGGDEDSAPRNANDKWLNPAIWQHVISSIGGGPLKTIGDILDISDRAISGEDLSISNIPVAKRFFMKPDERTLINAVNREYYDIKEDMAWVEDRVRKFNRKEYSGYAGYAEKLDFMYHSPDYLKYAIFEEGNKEIEKLDKKIKEEVDEKEIENLKAMSATKKDQLISKVNAVDRITETDSKDPLLAHYIGKDVAYKMRKRLKQAQIADVDNPGALSEYTQTPEFNIDMEIAGYVNQIAQIDYYLNDDLMRILTGQSRVQLEATKASLREALVELREAYEKRLKNKEEGRQ